MIDKWNEVGGDYDFNNALEGNNDFCAMDWATGPVISRTVHKDDVDPGSGRVFLTLGDDTILVSRNYLDHHDDNYQIYAFLRFRQPPEQDPSKRAQPVAVIYGKDRRGSSQLDCVRSAYPDNKKYWFYQPFSMVYEVQDVEHGELQPKLIDADKCVLFVIDVQKTPSVEEEGRIDALCHLYQYDSSGVIYEHGINFIGLSKNFIWSGLGGRPSINNLWQTEEQPDITEIAAFYYTSGYDYDVEEMVQLLIEQNKNLLD